MVRAKSRIALAVATAAMLVTALLSTMGPAQGAYPGTNGRIAFETSRDGNLEIYSMNPDGGDQTNLTLDEAEDTDPAWSPDGTRIAFVKASEGHRNIWVMNADGSGQTNLTPGPVTSGQANDGTNPTWSPDGSRIAYASSQGEIWVMSALDGSGKSRLATGVRSQPAWSPDGTKILHVHRADIWVMNADGTGLMPLTSTTGAGQDEKAPDWSPDGSQVVYGKGSAVWRMNADGSDQTLVVANSVLPAWSPDGTKIVFASSSFDALNGFDIFTVNPDGTSVTRIPTAADAIDNDPNWQPATAIPPGTTSTSSTSSTTTSTTTVSTSTTATTPAPTSTSSIPTSTTSTSTTIALPSTTTTTPSPVQRICGVLQELRSIPLLGDLIEQLLVVCATSTIRVICDVLQLVASLPFVGDAVRPFLAAFGCPAR